MSIPSECQKYVKVFFCTFFYFIYFCMFVINQASFGAFDPFSSKPSGSNQKPFSAFPNQPFGFGFVSYIFILLISCIFLCFVYIDLQPLKARPYSLYSLVTPGKRDGNLIYSHFYLFLLSSSFYIFFPIQSPVLSPALPDPSLPTAVFHNQKEFLIWEKLGSIKRLNILFGATYFGVTCMQNVFVIYTFQPSQN